MQLPEDELQKLKEELKERKTELRKEIQKELIDAASLGDLYRENFPFDAAVAKQRVNESRIADLEVLIREVKVKKSSNQLIEVGSKVKLKRGDQEIEIILVDEETIELNPRAGFISINSPLGSKISGKKVGATVKVKAPIGEIEFNILEIE